MAMAAVLLLLAHVAVCVCVCVAVIVSFGLVCWWGKGLLGPALPNVVQERARAHASLRIGPKQCGGGMEVRTYVVVFVFLYLLCSFFVPSSFLSRTLIIHTLMMCKSCASEFFFLSHGKERNDDTHNIAATAKRHELIIHMA
jgi:hypothetical protein